MHPTFLPRFLSALLVAMVCQVGSALETLPPLLETVDGAAITTAAEWEQNRPDVLSLFSRHVYGIPTVGRPDSLTFQVMETNPNAMGGAATFRRIRIGYTGPGGTGAINAQVYLPNNRPEPAPAFLFINNRGGGLSATGEFWSAREQVERGYAAVGFNMTDVASQANNVNDGVHTLFNPYPPDVRPDDSWGKIAAWAWGASRVLDFLETDAAIDADRVAVVGHSRAGKSALWAGATDERFALTVSNNSGLAGAAITRDKGGEQITDVNNGFPAWFAKNYKQFNGRPDLLPVDQHMLLAMMAPRPVYVASASGDSWSDPRNEFLAAQLATPAWELYGLEGLTADGFPSSNTALHDGLVGYHLRQGSHDLTTWDWLRFMDFADLHLAQVASVPEPAALGLLLAGVTLLGRRIGRKQAVLPLPELDGL